jgi:hypothetical protein
VLTAGIDRIAAALAVSLPADVTTGSGQTIGLPSSSLV